MVSPLTFCTVHAEERYMTLFSLVTVYLIGGFGIFYVLHSTLQPWYVTMLVAIAWTALLLWLFLANRPSEDR